IPSATSFPAPEPSTAFIAPASLPLLHLRRLARAGAPVTDVRNRLHGVRADLLVLAVRELLDRVRGRLRPVTLLRELHLVPEVVDRHLAAEERVRDLRPVGRA